MSTWKMMIKTMFKTTLFVVPVTITFTDLVANLSQVVGVSMQPLLNPDYDKGKKDWVLQNKLVVNQSLNRGDIITFIGNYDSTMSPEYTARPDCSTSTPYDPKQLAVKRIIATQGDLVRPKNKTGKVYVPFNYVWVEGDNSKHSHDSNSYGPISMSLITSKATHIVWPPSRWQKLDSIEIDCDRVIKIHSRRY